MLLRSRRSTDRSRRWVKAGGALVLALIAGAQTPQTPPRPEQKKPEAGGFTFKAESRLVVLHATVLDKDNRLVTNLPQSAFRVYENNVEQTLKVFKREDVPVSMALVIDNSGSMRDKRDRVNAAALTFVKASNPDDEIFIVNFNDEAFLDQDFTNNQELLQDALKKVDQRGGTAFYDALSMSIDHLRDKAKKDKKVALLITDGEDNASQITLEKIVRKAQEAAEVSVFSVGMLNEEERRAARRTKRALTSLAEVTGGEAFFPRDTGEVDQIARRIALDIRSQYILGYTPTNEAQDGSFRQVKVALVTNKNFTVRTRTGYYARGLSASAKVSPSQ